MTEKESGFVIEGLVYLQLQAERQFSKFRRWFSMGPNTKIRVQVRLVEGVQKLMEIRKDWTIADYEEWKTDESIPHPSGRTLFQWREYMEETLYNNYDPDYIQECIKNESY